MIIEIYSALVFVSELEKLTIVGASNLMPDDAPAKGTSMLKGSFSAQYSISGATGSPAASIMTIHR